MFFCNNFFLGSFCHCHCTGMYRYRYSDWQYRWSLLSSKHVFTFTLPYCTGTGMFLWKRHWQLFILLLFSVSVTLSRAFAVSIPLINTGSLDICINMCCVILGPWISSPQLDIASGSEAEQPAGGQQGLPQAGRFWAGQIFRIPYAAIHPRGCHAVVSRTRTAIWRQTIRHR
jgi:hypothetical protein